MRIYTKIVNEKESDAREIISTHKDLLPVLYVPASVTSMLNEACVGLIMCGMIKVRHGMIKFVTVALCSI